MKERRSIRLQGYNYSHPGAYFVTVCTRGRECLFGSVVNCEMQLNDMGRKVWLVWNDLPRRFANVTLDAFTVMPNHIHGIIFAGAQFIAPNQPALAQRGAMNRAPTLGEIVRTYKAVSTRLVKQLISPGFISQRNYYEHVIRNDHSLERIRDYIVNNPARWDEDEENPEHQTPSNPTAKRWLEPLS